MTDICKNCGKTKESGMFCDGKISDEYTGFRVDAICKDGVALPYAVWAINGHGESVNIMEMFDATDCLWLRHCEKYLTKKYSEQIEAYRQKKRKEMEG